MIADTVTKNENAAFESAVVAKLQPVSVQITEPAAALLVTPASITASVKPKHIVKTGKAYSYSSLKSDLNQLVSNYGDIVKLSVEGKSLEGRNIYLLKVGKGDKKVFIVGALHAREYVTANYVMKEVDQLAYSYYSKSGKFGEYNIRNLLNKVTLYIIPMANPDGVNIVLNGYHSSNYASIIKKKLNGKAHKSWKANARGVDLNRNFPQWWNKGDKSIRGPRPLSEPESKVIYKVYRSCRFSAASIFHTKGEILYWMDSNQKKYYKKMYPYAKKLSHMTGYHLVNYKTEGVFCGGVLDYIKKTTPSIPSFTFELCKPAGSPDIPFKDSKFNKQVWKKAKYIIPEIMKIGLY